jgi:hypothetical protein
LVKVVRGWVRKVRRTDVVSISNEPLRPDPRAHLKAQPSLFDQRQVKPPDAVRYQRGYTPQRMHEVRQATAGLIDLPKYGEVEPPRKEPCPTCGGKGHSPSFEVTPAHDNPTTRQHWQDRGIQVTGNQAHAPGQQCWSCTGKGSRSAARSTQREMSDSLDHPFYLPQGQGTRMIHEAIARSTLPTSHLEGLEGLIMPSERKVGFSGMKGVLGMYTGKRSQGTGKVRLFPVPAKTPKRGPEAGQRLIESMDVSARGGKPPMVPKTGSRQRQQSEATLIHEIGHHVSESAAGPAEEARADRYMVTHYRPDPRDVKAGRALNPNRTTYLSRLGGPYTARQFAETPVPEPRPPKQKRVNVRRALLKDPFK